MKDFGDVFPVPRIEKVCFTALRPRGGSEVLYPTEVDDLSVLPSGARIGKIFQSSGLAFSFSGVHMDLE